MTRRNKEPEPGSRCVPGGNAPPWLCINALSSSRKQFRDQAKDVPLVVERRFDREAFPEAAEKFSQVQETVP